MSGLPKRSGGWNRKPLEHHLAAGTYRADRHAAWKPSSPSAPVPLADRRRVLAGLPAAAKRLAGTLMDAYDGWDASSLETLRSYVLSVERVRQLEANGNEPAALHRELRSNLALLKMLHLEQDR